MADQSNTRRPQVGFIQKIIEPRTQPVPGLREMARHLDGDILGNTIVILLFGVTGPLIIAVTVAKAGGLSEAYLHSWIFAGLGLAGLASVFLSAWYRQPIVLLFSLPAAVLIGPALGHFSINEVIGAYIATGLVIVTLSLTGCVQAVMTAIPLPIVMSMAAGVFLPFVLRVVEGFGEVPIVALATVGTFVVFSAMPSIGRLVPPLLAALVAGAVATFSVDGPSHDHSIVLALAEPIVYMPRFSIEALAELVLPLTIVVLGIGNAPSYAILKNAGFSPPQGTITTGCGAGSIVLGILGSPPIANPGIVTGTLNRSGSADRRYLSGMLFGLLLFLASLLSPVVVDISLSMPIAFIGILAGLALFSVLQGAFVTAFTGGVPIGALTAFVVTVSDIPILGLGAPFWGLVFGSAATWLLEHEARVVRARSHQSVGTGPN